MRKVKIDEIIEKPSTADTGTIEANIIPRHSKLLSAFTDSIFDAEKHLYSIDGEQYRSVSSIIKQYENEFNEHLIAHMKAKGDESKKRAWLKYWDAKKDEAIGRGNRVHAYAELYPDLPPPSCEQEKGVFVWYNDNKHKYEVVTHEFRVYSKTRKIAGTIDLILYDRYDDSYIIIDWKSNKTHIGQYYGTNKLKGIFEHLSECSYNKYRLQQSLYKSVLEEAGIKVSKIMLVWLTNGDDEVIKKGYKQDDAVIGKKGDGYIEYDLIPVDCRNIDY